MDKVKGLFLADLAAFAVCAVGMSISHAPTVTASALIGVGASSVLMAKVPDKKSKESEILDKLLVSQSKVEELQAEKEWELKSAKSDLMNRLEEATAEYKEIVSQLECDKLSLEVKIKKNREREIEKLNKVKAEHEKQCEELKQEIARLEIELKAVCDSIESRELAIREEAEKLSKFKNELEKANVELGFREKELRLEEKRIKLDVKETQGNLKETLKNAELDVQVRDTINTRLQAELAEVKQVNRELWLEKYSEETDNRTAKIQAVLASAGCPTELISSDSTSCKLKPLSIDGWDKKGIENAAQQIPAFADFENPPKVKIKSGCIELVYDYQEAIKPMAKSLKFYDWADAKDEASGFVVCGNTGAGKTAVVLWLLGLLTEDSPKQIIVLDVHARMNHWHEYGLNPIYKQDEVIAALKAILAELKRRKELGINSPELITVLDEVAATRLNTLDKEEKQFINDALLLLGAEGRKFGIILIAMNQSKNVAALGIDGQNRNNYFLVLLCAAARDWAEYEWGKEDVKTKHIFDTPYSCVVSGCVSDQIALHPTHGSYHKFVKKGLQPQNMKPINALPFSIENLAVAVECEVIKNDEKLAKINEFWDKGEKRLTIIIPEVWGCESSGRAYNKARQEFKALTGE